MIKLKKIDEAAYEIPKEDKMRVKGVVFISEEMAKSEETHEALQQLKNTAYLPGVKGFVVGMPDIHYGYGFPIGGVVATDGVKGVISPGGVGYDINCGVRAIKTSFELKYFKKKLEEVIMELYNDIPAGVGSRGKIGLSKKDYKSVIINGAKWAVNEGYGEAEDLEFCENKGYFEGADPSDVSQEARERGKDELGTLGAGNHFVEISYVEKIYQDEAAGAFGLFPDQVIIMFHTGSRGFGYQICDDYLKKMRRKSMIDVPDPQLISVYIDDPLGKAYISAMKAAANFAWANRQLITHYIREGFERVFKVSYRKAGLDILYDVSHNIARFETHFVDGKKEFLCVHRKGATRAFPKGSPEIPGIYKNIGQPVLIPGDMGRSSYILKGELDSLKKSFGTTCHGAGRLLSRRRAVKQAASRNIRDELERQGIIVMSKSKKTLKEEMPEAYKDVSEVVKIVEINGLATPVARLKPIGVIKG